MKGVDDTIAALATPLGEAGLGVVRVSGPDALRVVTAFFQPANPPALAQSSPQGHRFGRLLDANLPGSTDSSMLDQAVVSVFRAPHSYTGQDSVEISVHGSPYVLERVVALCLRHGARMAEPGEFTLRAFLNGKLDLTQAEAVAELIAARTAATHRAAVSQLGGHLSARVRDLRGVLLPLLAHLEVGLDHSDEEHDFLDRQKLLERCTEVSKEILDLQSYAKIGRVLRDGFRVALIGRPNVGKSSLLNALLRDERAIVTPVAGTTRDTLEESLDIDGVRVVLTDTAGLRRTEDVVERLGVDRSRRAAQGADLVLTVFDGSEPLTPEDHALLAEWRSNKLLGVVNKCDQPSVWNPTELGLPARQLCKISAQAGTGLDTLLALIKESALTVAGSTSEPGFLLNSRHREALERAHESLAHAIEAIRANREEECIALDLRTALNALGEIIGETTTEDLLGQIFSQFCVGK